MGDERREEDLVQAVALDDSAPESGLEWLEAIYREHSRSVIRTAFRITGNAEDAEDVLQTVFLRLARRESAPDLERGAGAYLRRAATNAALDIVQSRRAVSRSGLDESPAIVSADPTPDRLHQAKELGGRLREAVAALGRRSAEAFVLRYFEDLDNRAVADILGTTPGAVSVTLHRARARLLEDLRPYLGGMR